MLTERQMHSDSAVSFPKVSPAASWLYTPMKFHDWRSQSLIFKKSSEIVVSERVVAKTLCILLKGLWSCSILIPDTSKLLTTVNESRNCFERTALKAVKSTRRISQYYVWYVPRNKILLIWEPEFPCKL
jgi:hypothetical protein